MLPCSYSAEWFTNLCQYILNLFVLLPHVSARCVVPRALYYPSTLFANYTHTHKNAEMYIQHVRLPPIIHPFTHRIVPGLRKALETWQTTGDRRDINVADIPGLRVEAPGVVSFDCLQPDICDQLLAEVVG